MTTVREIRTNTRPAVMTWVPVTDPHGAVRMEMRWHVGERPARAHRAAA
ncbi:MULTISPECIES: hypothetical protein [unclassified Ornithinimicrobium]